MNKKIVTTLFATSMTILLAACGNKTASSKQTLARMTPDVIATMDSAVMTDPTSGQTISDTMSGLLRYNNKKLEPDMAKAMPTVSKDQKTYTFHLRHGSKWSDGKEVTAADFVYAWQRVVTPATKSPYAYIMSGIINADDIAAGKKKPSTLGVEAKGKYTFIVHLDHAMPYFEKMIGLVTFNPVEKSFVEKVGKKYATSSKYLTFNGPYKLNTWSGSDDNWSETKNNNYWNAKAYKINTLKYQVVKSNSTATSLFNTGKLDDVTITGNDALAAKSKPSYNTVQQSYLTYLGMSQKVKAFQNQKIRQALSIAIDRDNFIAKVLGDGSKPAKTVVPTGMYYNDKTGEDFGKVAAKGYEQYTTYNLKKARTLFAEGMKEIGSKSLNFTLLSDNTAGDTAAVEYLQAAFKKLGTSENGLSVNVTSRIVPQKTWIQESHSGQYEMTIGEWAADFPDAINFLNTFSKAYSSYDGKYNNDEYNALVKASNTTDATNPTKRWDDMIKADQILTKNLGVIPVFQWGTAHLTNTNVKNLHYEPNSLFSYQGTTNKAK
jgi:oligopeptide transport system substrate-binding protein